MKLQSSRVNIFKSRTGGAVKVRNYISGNFTTGKLHSEITRAISFHQNQKTMDQKIRRATDIQMIWMTLINLKSLTTLKLSHVIPTTGRIPIRMFPNTVRILNSPDALSNQKMIAIFRYI
jgi:hypothetical protein